MQLMTALNYDSVLPHPVDPLSGVLESHMHCFEAMNPNVGVTSHWHAFQILHVDGDLLSIFCLYCAQASSLLLAGRGSPQWT